MKPSNLLTATRNELIDAQFYGFLGHYALNGLLGGIGEAKDYPFFLRSTAKPIQASLMEDFKTHEYFGFSGEEIAVFCASHSAQNYHIKLVRSVLKKTGLNESALLCGTHPPFAPREDALNMPVHNNCSGKHALMLAFCVQNGWNIANYCDFEHPLQKLIYERHLELSRTEVLQSSLDGCGTPIWAMSLEQMAKSFLNLFEKYNIVKNAFLGHPLVIGGPDRTDTKIMLASPDLIAKIGAGGLLLVYNTLKHEVLIIKLLQENNSAREIIASYALNQLGWLNSPIDDYKIRNLHGTTVGSYVFCDTIRA